MTRTIPLDRQEISKHAKNNCSVRKALDAFGDRWSLLIIRELFYGIRRFSDFQRELGIARNVLSARLQKLHENGIIERISLGETISWHEYRLTEKGADLFPMVMALLQWGDRWMQEGAPPLKVVETKSGAEIDPIAATVNGRPIHVRDASYQTMPDPS